MLGSKRPAAPAFSDRVAEDLKCIKSDALSLYESTIRNMQEVSKSEEGERSSCLDCSPCCSAARQTGMRLSASNRKFSISSFSGKLVSVDLASAGSNVTSSGHSSSNTPTCFHCRRKACLMCCRQCARCDEDFCSVCSILDFQERYDRAYCLDCYAVVPSTNSR